MGIYNGNIAETFWITSSDNNLRKYGYTYDDLNRLTNAIYKKPNYNMPVTNMYNESLTYDKNGNIQTLQRNGDFDWDATSGPLQIDNLSYFYDTNNPNQLTKVSDSTNNPKGFVDGTNDDNDYAYDANGNMIYDKNKTIENIRYNHLNLPTQISFSSGNIINYLYNAIGQKVRKTVRVDGTGLETYYLDGFQYSGGKLRFFPHAEGYVTASYCESEQCDMSVPRQLSYVYNYTDHLGNIRLSYGYDPKAEQLKILEENHYYPFGLKHTNYSNYRKKYSLEEVLDNEQNSNWQNLPSTQAKQTVLRIKQIITGESVAYNYKFSGKEYQDELGLNVYDFGGRLFMPDIVRTPTIDPKSEKFYDLSPYSFLNNNPLTFTDPTGMISEAVIQDLWNKSGSGETKWTNTGNGSFSGNGQTVPAGDGDKDKDKKKGKDNNKTENNKDKPLSSKISEYTNYAALATVVIGLGPEDPVTDVIAGGEEAVGQTLAGLTYLAEGAFALGVDYFARTKSKDSEYNSEAEHTANARPSSRATHEKGQSRKSKDKGGEKGDARRTRYK